MLRTFTNRMCPLFPIEQAPVWQCTQNRIVVLEGQHSLRTYVIVVAMLYVLTPDPSVNIAAYWSSQLCVWLLLVDLKVSKIHKKYYETWFSNGNCRLPICNMTQWLVPNDQTPQ